MARTKKPTLPTCDWREDEDGNWHMDCGEIFVLNDGTPSENGMRYCCGCGRILHEVRYRGEPR